MAVRTFSIVLAATAWAVAILGGSGAAATTPPQPPLDPEVELAAAEFMSSLPVEDLIRAHRRAIANQLTIGLGAHLRTPRGMRRDVFTYHLTFVLEEEVDRLAAGVTPSVSARLVQAWGRELRADEWRAAAAFASTGPGTQLMRQLLLTNEVFVAQASSVLFLALYDHRARISAAAEAATGHRRSRR